MEKIQSAIAKARAARSAQLSGQDDQISGQLADAPALPPSAKSQGTLIHGTETTESPRLVRDEVPAPSVNPFGNSLDITKHWLALQAATIPPRMMEENRIPAFAGGPEATYFDMLRTRLLQQMAQNGWKRLAITSPGPGCGKTTLALNLAFALARRPDQRAILAEVDLRRPSAQKIMGQRQAHSFADVLAGRASFADNAFRVGTNLAFATNELASRAAPDALHGDGVAKVLDQISADYDPSLWIFDMPPMLANDDTLAFVPHVDCAIILAAAEMTSIKELDKCERELSTQTNVLGVILNKCRYLDRHETYKYY